MGLNSAIQWAGRKKGRWVLILGMALVVYWVLRGCLPSFGGPRLPSSLESDLRQRYTVCITDTPIWPGEPRQPECGQVTIDVAGDGMIPAAEASSGADRAVCFHVTITTPTWTTQGTTRHEIIQHRHLMSKVAVRRNGKWVVAPDEDQLDESQWILFACPGSYKSEPISP